MLLSYDPFSEVTFVFKKIFNNFQFQYRYNEDKEQDFDFANEHILKVFRQFLTPLRNAGMSDNINEVEILSEWHDLISYSVKYLSPSHNDNKKTMKRLFSSAKCKKDFKNILLLIECVYTLPVSSAKCERTFSLMRRIKTNTRSSLGDTCLENTMRICLEGPDMEHFDFKDSIKRWKSKKVRRPNQRKLHRQYKKRNTLKKAIGLPSSSSSSSESDQE